MYTITLVTCYNMQSVSSNAVAKALETKAPLNAGVKYHYFTPRQISDNNYVTSVIYQDFLVEGYNMSVFCVGWEEYQSFPTYAGAQGVFYKGGGSAQAFGQLRNYDARGWSLSIFWTDSISVGGCSGWG